MSRAVVHIIGLLYILSKNHYLRSVLRNQAVPPPPARRGNIHVIPTEREGYLHVLAMVRSTSLFPVLCLGGEGGVLVCPDLQDSSIQSY